MNVFRWMLLVWSVGMFPVFGAPVVEYGNLGVGYSIVLASTTGGGTANHIHDSGANNGVFISGNQHIVEGKAITNGVASGAAAITFDSGVTAQGFQVSIVGNATNSGGDGGWESLYSAIGSIRITIDAPYTMSWTIQSDYSLFGVVTPVAPAFILSSPFWQPFADNGTLVLNPATSSEYNIFFNIGYPGSRGVQGVSSASGVNPAYFSSTLNVTFTPVSEPSTLALAVGAMLLAGMAFRGRRSGVI